jgi:hypothetical protein
MKADCRRRIASIRTGVLLLCTVASAAEGAPPSPASLLPAIPSAAAPSPGAWVQYSVVPRRGPPFLLRLAALEREGAGQWVEIGITDAVRRTLLVKVLVEGTLAAPKRIRRAIVQPQGLQAFYLPDKLALKQLPPFREGPGPMAQKVARVRVTVPGGSFAADHYRAREKGRTVEAWFSSEVVGWPMVKMSTPDVLFELTAHGQKGSSQIRGKPAKLSEELLRGLGGP